MRSIAATFVILASLCAGCGSHASDTLSYRLPMLAYSPYHGDSAGACPSASDILDDFTKMRGISGTIRIYGLRDCDQGASAMAAAKSLGMKVNLGMWLESVASDTNGVQPAAAELAALDELLGQYGGDNVAMITVGNETQQTTTVSETTVLDTIAQVRALLLQRQLSIPVTTAQVLTDYTAGMEQAVDLLLPNIHPYWAGMSESTSAAWVLSQVQDLQTKTGKPVKIGETGWPTVGATLGSAVPSTDNAGAYLQSFYCAAQAAGVDYTYFEGFDLPENPSTAEVEAHWGLMDETGTLKPDVPENLGCWNTSTKGLTIKQ